MKNFGVVLGKYRTRKGLTQVDLSLRTKTKNKKAIAPNTISRIESKSHPASLSVAIRLIEALDLNNEEMHEFAHEVFGIPTLIPDLKDPLLNELLDLINNNDRSLLRGLIIGIRSMSENGGGDAMAKPGDTQTGYG